MAPPAKKRRTTRSSAAAEATQAAPLKPVQEVDDAPSHTSAQIDPPVTQMTQHDPPITQVEPAPPAPAAEPPAESETQPPTAAETEAEAVAKANDRMARFKALKARAKNSSETNFKEATKESQRLASDPSQFAALQRKHTIASHKLLKAEVEEAGEDFERKRAWDWTVEESERWDKRVKKKSAHRDNNAFRDDQQESNKVYKRQLRNIKPDLDQYDKQKMAAIEKAAASGGLDIVETENGELIAVDKDGSFYSTADSTTFTQNKPDRAAVDRLVQDMKRAEEQRLKKRRDRMGNNGDDGDVTYINEKNKQFNQKLSRFYDKYTADIRDSFERGTMI